MHFIIITKIIITNFIFPSYKIIKKIVDVIINVFNINQKGGEYMEDVHFIIITAVANVISNCLCKLLGIF